MIVILALLACALAASCDFIDYFRCSDLRSSKNTKLFKHTDEWTVADTLLCKAALYIDRMHSYGPPSHMHYHKQFEEIFRLIRLLHRTGNEEVNVVIRATAFGASWTSQRVFLDDEALSNAQFDQNLHFDQFIRDVRSRIDNWLDAHDRIDVSVQFYDGRLWEKESTVEIRHKPL